MAKELSIIIPAYNEAKIIGKTIDEIKAFCEKYYFDYEIIVVDDGSDDNTSEIILNKGAILIRHENNKGKGYTMRSGLRYARFKTILFLDADLSVNIKELFKFNYLWLKSRQIIKGQRIQMESQPIYRLLLGKIWKILVFLKIGIYKDTQCPFLILNGKLAKYCLEINIIDGFAYDIGFIRQANKGRIPITWVDVEYYNQKDSKVTFRKIVRMFLDLIKLK